MLSALGRGSAANPVRVVTTDGGSSQEAKARAGSGSLRNLLPSTLETLRLRRRRAPDNQATSNSSHNVLGDLFLSLPAETQVEVLLYLPVEDILAARLVSRAFDDIVTCNGAAIARECVLSKLAHCHGLRPPAFDLPYLYTVLRRHHVASALAHIFADFVTTEILRRRSRAKNDVWAADHARLCVHMTPLLFALAHAYDAADAFLAAHPPLACGGRHLSRAAAAATFAAVLTEHPAADAADVPSMQGFLLGAYRRMMRPPTYASELEKSLRGWGGTPAPVAALQANLWVGGLPQLRRLLAQRTYGARTRAALAFALDVAGRRRRVAVPAPAVHAASGLTCIPYGSDHAAGPRAVGDTAFGYCVRDPLTARELYMRGVLDCQLARHPGTVGDTARFICGMLGWDFPTSWLSMLQGSMTMAPTLAPALASGAAPDEDEH